MFKNQIYFFMFATSLYQSSFANQQLFNEVKYKLTKADQVIQIIQNSNEKNLPKEFNLASLDLKQIKTEAKGLQYFSKIISNNDIVLVQNITNESKYLDSVNRLPYLYALFAGSHYLPKSTYESGVMTLTTAQSKTIHFQQNSIKENFSKNPQIILMQEFDLSENDQVLIINIQTSNTDDLNFKSQINEITPILRKYHGRIILSGNQITNSPTKAQWLQQRLAEYDLRPLNTLHNDNTNRIFTRGCIFINTIPQFEPPSLEEFAISLRLRCE